MRVEDLTVDFLVIGSGIAGLTFAMKVADHGSCLIVTKKEDKESNTNYAQGGIAAVIDPNDSFASHIQDTLVTGAGLCRKAVVETLVSEGPDRVRELVDLGAEFTTYRDREGHKLLRLSREGGHSANRIVFSKDTTGQEVERILLNKIYEKKVTILENHPVIKLVSDRTRIYGAWLYNRRQGKLVKVRCNRIMLACGGAGRLFPYTTNPVVATGEGMVLAYQAGARLKNLEFIQFHPTALYQPDEAMPSAHLSGERVFLISEAVRGEGGILRNGRGEEFMNFHPLKNLAPRDIVAREIDKQMKASGSPFVFLDISHMDAEFIKTRFPNIYHTCKERGIDITREAIPVVPAAHYFCGGVETDIWGRTGVTGLYAAGEVSYTGVHGANRLASNSLLEAMVFSHRAAQDALESEIGCSDQDLFNDLSDLPRGMHIRGLWENYQNLIRTIMWRHVGIVRTNQGLDEALKKLVKINTAIKELYIGSYLQVEAMETMGIGILAELVVRSALLRRESRGAHYNLDYDFLDKRLYETYIGLDQPAGGTCDL